MGYSYQPLWNLLTEKGITKTELKEAIGISSTTLAKLSANKLVSMEVLSKICDKLGCDIKDIVVYYNDMQLFMKGLKDTFKDCGYTLYIDRWPKCWFKLSQSQAQTFEKIDKMKLKQIINICEQKANQENYPNAGILGSTKINFYPDELQLVIQGSFAVIELFIREFVYMCSQI